MPDKQRRGNLERYAVGIITSFKKLIDLFNKREKINSVIMLALIAVGAVAETVGIGVILPFTTVLLDQNSVEQYPILKTITEISWVGGYRRFIVMMCIALVLIFILKSIYMFFLIYVQNKFSLNRQIEMSRKLFQSYIYKPYEYFFSKNTAELQRNVNVLIGTIIKEMLMYGLFLLTELMIVLFIMVFLLIIDPISSISIMIILGGIAIGFYFVLKSRLDTSARKQNIFGNGMVKSVNEGLGSIKDTKVLGREDSFLAKYERNGSGYAKATAFQNLAYNSPRLLIETIAVSGLVIIVVINALRNPDMNASLPTIALFGIAAIRIMPSMNRIIGYMAAIRASITHFNVVYDDLKEALMTESATTDSISKVSFRNRIEIKKLTYKYPGSSAAVLDNVELIVEKGQAIGIVGNSGAGKTTLIDILLGLLPPEQGEIRMDGNDISNNIRGYRRNIGYVPQDIFIIDDTVAANVAFGVAADEIDNERVWKSLETANLKDYAESLKDGLDTNVGESGMRLSGGQRQRLGIARALYNDPEILILDEATSSLDTESERIISEAITRIGRAKTMIIVAHRLNTLEKCDVIYEIKDNHIQKRDSL